MIYWTMRFLAKITLRLFYKVRYVGLENIPNTGNTVIVSNHVKALDPAFIAIILKRPMTYMSKKEMFSNPIVAWFLKQLSLIPVNRGGADIKAIKSSINAIENGRVFGIFPEGTRSKDGELGEARGGAAMIALKSKSVIVPVAISKDYSIFKKVSLSFGKPIDISPYFDKKIDTSILSEISDIFMAEIKKLLETFEK